MFFIPRTLGVTHETFSTLSSESSRTGLYSQCTRPTRNVSFLSRCSLTVPIDTRVPITYIYIYIYKYTLYDSIVYLLSINNRIRDRTASSGGVFFFFSFSHFFFSSIIISIPMTGRRREEEHNEILIIYRGYCVAGKLYTHFAKR